MEINDSTVPAYGLTFAATTNNTGITGRRVDCGYGYQEEIPQDVQSNIALLQRGAKGDEEFYFTAKVENVQEKGAEAAIIYNNATGAFRGSLIYPENWIPAVSISAANGKFLLENLSSRVSVVNQLVEKKGNYRRMSGTSMATAVVSGTVGLLASWREDLGILDIKQALMHSAQPLQDKQSSLVAGGMVNVYNTFANLVLPGDVDLNGEIGLRDAVLGMKIITKRGKQQIPGCLADIDGDGKIWISEVSRLLQNIR